MAGGEELVDYFDMAVHLGKLKNRLSVPIKPAPLHALKNRLNSGVGRTLTIGILYPKRESTSVVACIQPVEQRRANAANVEEAGR